MADIEKYFHLWETHTLFAELGFSGTKTKIVSVQTGSRLIFTLEVLSIDFGATLTFKANNGYSKDYPLCEILNVPMGSVSVEKRVLTDFHNYFEYEVEVVGGSAEFAIGISVHDNAMTTRIENAVIEVDLSHTLGVDGKYDSVRIGDGFDELQIYKAFGNPSDGSISIFDQGYSLDTRTKNRLMCSPDLLRNFTWEEIDCTWRVTQIVFTSPSLNTNMGQSISLTRTFTYEIADPFNLEDIEDVLTVA